MDSFNNPFIKLNIYVINANEQMIILGIEKIVVASNLYYIQLGFYS